MAYVGRSNVHMIEIQYLESIENLRKNICASQGWTPSAGQANAIVACLRQGRLFFEAAARAPLEIRPLELYYGASAYAKAIVLATDRKRRIEALQQSHGVKDKSAHDSRLDQLKIVIENRGTFQEFNDCVREFNHIQPMSFDGRKDRFFYKSADSTSLVGVSLSLKEIFSRLPGLEALYHATFDERANIDFVQVSGPEEGASWELRVASSPLAGDFNRCVEQITDYRERMPFLRRWTFIEAGGVGQILAFRNAEPSEDELDPNVVRNNSWGFSASAPPYSRYFKDIKASIGPLMGMPGLSGGGYYMQPVEGKCLAFQSLQFLALHLLSSLVRYRPATWMHSLSRSANEGRAADDAMLALIESFMETVYKSMPVFVAEVLTRR